MITVDDNRGDARVFVGGGGDIATAARAKHFAPALNKSLSGGGGGGGPTSKYFPKILSGP